MLLPIREGLDMDHTMHGNMMSSRQITPPDSPRARDHTMLPPIKTSFPEHNTQSRPSGKMSLDFIAPGSGSRSSSPEGNSRTLPRLEVLSAAAAIHRGSRPSSPFLPSTTVATLHPAFTPHNSPHYTKQQPYKEEYYTPVSANGGLPSPVWSSYSEPHPIHGRDSVHFGLPHQERRSSDPAYLVARDIRPLYTPPGVRPARIQKRSPRAAPLSASRGERHPYDAEERFALVYLRREDFEKKLEWKDVLNRYHHLFPPGAPRRYKSRDGAEARGLPSHYPHREVQGLQCRLYRIRTEEGLPKSRDAAGVGGIDTPTARAAVQDEMEKLEHMALRDRLSPSFVRKVKQLATKGELNDLLAYTHQRI